MLSSALPSSRSAGSSFDVSNIAMGEKPNGSERNTIRVRLTRSGSRFFITSQTYPSTVPLSASPVATARIVFRSA